MGMQTVRDSSWILLGVLLGSASCLIIVQGAWPSAMPSTSALATVTLYSMLIGSLLEPWTPLMSLR